MNESLAIVLLCFALAPVMMLWLSQYTHYFIPDVFAGFVVTYLGIVKGSTYMVAIGAVILSIAASTFIKDKYYGKLKAK